MLKRGELSRRLRGIACLLFITILAGCAVGLKSQSVAPNLREIGGLRVLLMQTQLISGEDTYSMELIVDASTEKLTIIGSSLGIRLFTLSYDGVTVTEGLGRGLPFYISNRLVVDDVMLALASTQALKANLPADCSIFTDSNLEKIHCEGKLTVSVKRYLTPSGNAAVSIQRFHPNYELNIVMSEVQ